MLWCKYKKLKKGYSLVTTLIIGMLCVTIILVCLKFQLDEYKYTIYSKRFITKTDTNNEKKEYLLSTLNNEIMKNVLILTRSSINNYLLAKTEDFKVIYNNSYLKYNNLQEAFVIYYSIDEYSHMESYFEYEITENKIKYIFIRNVFVEGGIEI